jgi:hypothetical protein
MKRKETRRDSHAKRNYSFKDYDMGFLKSNDLQQEREELYILYRVPLASFMKSSF